MKKRELITYSIIIFLISLTIIITPAILPVLGVSGNTTTFNVIATVSGGVPTITYVDAITGNPVEGATTVINFYFNATHPNGKDNIQATGAHIRINQSSTVIIDSGCTVSSTDGAITNRFNCSVAIPYYTLPGTWTINATIDDLAANRASNTTSVFTNGNTYGIAIKTTTITFGGDPGQTVGATDNPQHVNNTGNVGYSQINLTAFNLASGANVIGAGNFTANTTASGGAGHTLINDTPVTLLSSNISVNASRNMYLYLAIPVGAANGTYNAVSPWVITVR